MSEDDGTMDVGVIVAPCARWMSIPDPDKKSFEDVQMEVIDRMMSMLRDVKDGR